MDITQYFVSFAALVPLVVLIADFLIRMLKIEKSALKQITAWAVSVILCLLAMWWNIGMFTDLNVVHTILYAFGAGLAANGFFDIGIIQTLLNFLLQWLPKKQETE